MRVTPNRYQVDTIAGFCLRYGASYPALSGLGDAISPSGSGWNTVYPAADLLLSTDVVMEILAASYAGVFVDEYQDCAPEQHAIVLRLAAVLPVRVLGDPLQSIFAFRGAPIDWTVVETNFPPIAPLTTPWRWKSTNPALGEWLLSIREPLARSEPLTLSAGDPVVRLSESEANIHLLTPASPSHSVVAIRKWERDTHDVASRLGGAYAAIETVDCKDLSTLARDLDKADRRLALIALLDVFRRSTIGMNHRLGEVIEQLRSNQKVGLSDWPELRDALHRFYKTGGPAAVIDAVDALIGHRLVKRFRAELLEEVAHAANAVAADDCASFAEAAWLVRDHARRLGRRPELRVVSRTLLVKGLEFDHAVVLRPEELTANDLYVALTRGCRSAALVEDGTGIVPYDGAH